MLEIYWPGEMKRLVSKYREAGTLNEKAVGRYNYLIGKGIVVISSLSLILLIAGEAKTAGILFLLTLFAPLIDAPSNFRRRFLPYEGRKVIGKITRVEWHLYGSGLVIYYRKDGSSDEVTVLPERNSIKKEDTPKVGDELTFYEFNIGSANYAMPDIQYLNKTYSLSTANI